MKDDSGKPPYDELRRREQRYRRGYYYYSRRWDRYKKVADKSLDILKVIIAIGLYELIK